MLLQPIIVHPITCDPEPPTRDADGYYTKVRVRRIPNLHLLTALSANAEEKTESRLPAPQQPLLTRLNDMELAEEIERYIDYVDPKTRRSVHLGMQFVRHYLRRDDNVLPLISAVTTMPLVLPDGSLYAPRGLDPDRGIVFRVQPELVKYLPEPQECDDHAVIDALEFLINDWLVDVPTTFQGKCGLIALALTIIQRNQLPNRPVFWVTAGRRGGGKTTALSMVILAVTGVLPAAAAWSPSGEERRKALFAYLLEGIPCLVWDNIPHGAFISCPHIARSCTTAWYTDRKLGVSEAIATAASTIQAFTGNNCGPKGDLTSRSIDIRLVVDRPDPENREFKHPDPIGWTEAHRGQILKSLYTLLLAFPAVKAAKQKATTRFKTWWNIVGAPIEHAAALAGGAVDFGRMFIDLETDEPESASLADVLEILSKRTWPPHNSYDAGIFSAQDLANWLNANQSFMAPEDREEIAIVRQVLFPHGRADTVITRRLAGYALRSHVENPVVSDARTLLLVRIGRNENDTFFKVTPGGSSHRC
jgi:hypothetical protein